MCRPESLFKEVEFHLNAIEQCLLSSRKCLKTHVCKLKDNLTKRGCKINHIA